MYWDSLTIKNRAKKVLENHYWEYFLAVVACSLICGFTARLTLNIDIKGQHLRTLQDVIDFLLAVWRRYYPSIVSTLAVSGFGRCLWKIFITNAFETGSCRYRTIASYGHYDFQNIFYAFSKDRYINIVKTILIRDIYVFLWSALLIVPGIIKSYSYFMVPYIMAENPGITTDRAFSISKSVTTGEKWRIFILDLSFAGWFLLGTLCFGLGVLFVLPYHQAAHAELYGALRFKAVRENLVNREEIGAELFD